MPYPRTAYLKIGNSSDIGLLANHGASIMAYTASSNRRTLFFVTFLLHFLYFWT